MLSKLGTVSVFNRDKLSCVSISLLPCCFGLFFIFVCVYVCVLLLYNISYTRYDRKHNLSVFPCLVASGSFRSNDRKKLLCVRLDLLGEWG